MSEEINPYSDDAVEKYKKLGRQCRQMTMFCYPKKMTVEEFFDELVSSRESFIANMNKYPEYKEPKWAEDWMETFQAWNEMEKGDFD